MISSGPLATSGDAAVDVFPAGTKLDGEVNLINEGAAPGFVTLDGGTSWCRVPAGPCSRTFSIRHLSGTANVKIKRVASGTDMSAVYADGH
jgi:hypothetical protein